MKGRLAVALLAVACTAPPTSLDRRYADARRDLQLGDLQSASARAKEGLREASDRGLIEWQRAFQVLEAEVLIGQRRISEGLARLEPVLDGTTPADETSVRARMIRGHARCLSTTGPDSYDRAEVELAEAAAFAARGGFTTLAGDVALRRGTCRLLAHDVAAAETHFREALGLAREHGLGLLEVSAMGSLGLLRIRTSRYDEATTWLTGALELATRLDAQVLVVKTLGNLGWCYYRLGDYERALPMLRQAEARAGSRGLSGDRLTALINIGNAHFKLEDYAAAAEVYARALTLARELGSRAETAILLGNLGAVSLELGRYRDAETHVAQALDPARELQDEEERQRLLHVRADTWAARGALAQARKALDEIAASSHTPPDLAWQAHASLARVHVAAERPGQAETEFRRALSLMDHMRATLHAAEHRITFFASLRRFHDDYVAFLIDTGRPGEALELADRSRARLLGERLGHATAPAGSVGRFQRMARGLDAVLLAYWTAPGRSFLWVVTGSGVELHTLPDEAALRRDVEAYQAVVLRSRDPFAEATPEGERLWHQLVAPAAGALGAGARVIVLPDGPLHQLNFETLIVPGPRRRYWIEDVTLALAPSLSLIEGGPGRRPEPGTALLIGDPVSPGDEFPRLAHAGRELATVASQFDTERVVVLSGPAAEPGAYRRSGPGRFAYIHFAAHVTANRENPLESAVVLSPHNEVYKLYARDVVELPLAADLVTLSACRSAGSRAFAGEGLVGLSWAFLSAGAAHVVGGLWNVEDASTAKLMATLYRGLADGLDPPAALREAKLRLVRSPTAYRKPYYWAPFVVYLRRTGGGLQATPGAGYGATFQ